ncbi:MAG: Ig-like domain-containing protein [Bacteroidales bacterium]|nr:Ig-like domain-containing protein [Bacteroidales bacterium]
MLLIKELLKRYYPAIPMAFMLVGSFFSHSCANTTQRPTGGPKDSIPPVLLAVYPQPKAVGVPVSGQEFYFRFDEYFSIKEAQNIYLSPPLSKRPKTRINEKSLYVTFEDTLLFNTTYTLSLNGAIADNHESNIFPGYTYVFSTGQQVDSFFITGIIQDNQTLAPVKGATAMLYTDLSDSAIFLSRPAASAKSDDWGFFRIRNIKDTLYRIFALTDDNNNGLYDPDNEKIAFIDSLIRPSLVVDETLPEIRNFDMKDTVRCLARKPQYELNLFKEKPSVQYVKNSGRTSDRACFVSFMAQNAHIDTLWMREFPADRIITQINRERDSLELWVNDKHTMPDTFHLFVNYLKPDSLGVPTPFTEEVKLVNPHPRGRKRYISKSNLKHEDTICTFKLDADPKTMEQIGLRLNFGEPVVNIDTGGISMKSINPRQKVETVGFTFERDSLDLKSYCIQLVGKYMPGYEYILKIKENTFRNINGFGNDSTEVKVKLPNDEKLSTLTLNLSGVKNQYMVDLMDKSKTKSIRSHMIDCDTTIVFPYVSKDTYYIRFIEDSNRNFIVDAGNVLKNILPEKVLFYKMGDGKSEYLIPAGAELTQDIDLCKMFGKDETD